MKKVIASKSFIAISIALALTGCNSNNNTPTERPPVEECKTYESTDEVIVISDNQSVTSQTITIGATGDMHGRIRSYDYAKDATDHPTGFTKIQTLLLEERSENENMVMIDLGDTVQGNSAELFNSEPVHPVVDTMNHMQYDVWVPGNHEFDFDRDFLDRNLAAFNQSVISSNIVWDKDSEACASEGETPFVRAYQIFEIDGAKVAVVGVTPSMVPAWHGSSPHRFRNLAFNNELASVKKSVNEAIEKHSPDVVIGAFHYGRDDGGRGVHQIASELADKFDVIFMGHEHAQFIEQVEKGAEYPAAQPNISVEGKNLEEDKGLSGTYDYSNRNEKVKVIEPGKWGWALAKAEIELEQDIDGNWRILDTTLSNRAVAEVEEDAELVEKMDRIHQTSVEDANKVMGNVVGNFTFTGHETKFGGDEAVHEDPQNDGEMDRLYTTIHHAKVADMPLVDFINQIQVQTIEANATDENDNPVKVDVSAAALFGDASNLVDGQLFAKKDSATLYEYDNMLVATKIKGDKLQAFMEWSYSYFNQYQAGDITVSFNPDVRSYNYDLFDAEGFTYYVDLAQEAGHRVTITSIGGADFDENETYVIAVNDYRFSSTMVAKGWVTEDDKIWDSANETTYAIRDMLTKYVQENGSVAAADFTNQNWYLTQYGKPNAEGVIEQKGEILAERETEAGAALWKKLQDKEICVLRAESRNSALDVAVNVNNAESYTVNTQPGSYQGCAD